MFEKLKHELRRLEGANQISVSIQTDEDGYFDRQCQKEGCSFEFKVQIEDWLEKIQERAFCPFCGHSTGSDDWNTEEQSEHFSEVAFSHVSQRIGRAMRSDAERWNRRQSRNGFISVTMKVDGRPTRILLPPSAADPMQLRIECSQCGCRYAVIGAAFFCPGCGHNDAEVLFSLTISNIRKALYVLSEVRSAISDISDRDTAENIARSLVEYGLQNAVTAFQRYAEVLFSQVAVGPKPRRNAFQNLSKGSKLWFDATGDHYSEYLSVAEYAELKCVFQQRHLLAHTQGIVDQGYIENSGDTSHRLGQRLVIGVNAVRHYLDVIQKLAADLLEARNACLGQSFNGDLSVSDDT